MIKKGLTFKVTDIIIRVTQKKGGAIWAKKREAAQRITRSRIG